MLTTNTQAAAAVKKILGVAHTDIAKSIGNEALKTGFSVSASTVFGGDVPSTPSKAALYAMTGGVVEFVRLKMVADPSSNGHAYFAQLPANYSVMSQSPRKGRPEFANSSFLHSSAGKVQIVPASFGGLYEAKPYSGGSSAMGSGTVVSPADARDWTLDVYNGVFYQQGSGGVDSTVDWLECFIWVGGFVTDLVGSVTAGNQVFANGVVTVPVAGGFFEVDNAIGADAAFSVAKWYITAKDGLNSYVTELTAVMNNGTIAFNEYGRLVVGTQLLQVAADVNLGQIRLLVKPTIAGQVVNVKRLVVV